MKFDEIINIIFENKSQYSTISDKDKIDGFYMINKKFSIKYPGISKFLNDKNIDRASAVDMWFLKFKNVHNIPYWYWTKSPYKKTKKIKLSGPDTEKIKSEFELTDDELEFLYENFKDDVDYELKLIKRWEKNK